MDMEPFLEGVREEGPELGGLIRSVGRSIPLSPKAFDMERDAFLILLGALFLKNGCFLVPLSVLSLLLGDSDMEGALEGVGEGWGGGRGIATNVGTGTGTRTGGGGGGGSGTGSGKGMGEGFLGGARTGGGIGLGSGLEG